MIKVEGIKKRFDDLEVLHGVSLEVKRGEIVSLVGASGAGKTTLLQIIGTLMKADEGRVTIDGISPEGLDDKALSMFRNLKIGFVFQFHHLLEEFSARENVMLPMLIAGVKQSDAKERADELLALVSMSHRAEHKPSAMSGGEQQRVAVARALANNPAVVLADEPTGNLDSATRDELQRLFFTLRERTGQTFIIVTHDEKLASMSDRKIVMSDGRIL
ncbi:MAG: ABC transporter ATP-binding protein [Alistipes sp.]|nr:ABC transporter ATP-binding protein [Alistipes sp.]MBQ6939851.1 ABC transporter ATP-binding protein [Alistipes sp.]MBR2436668.1 ABC transporter ATP-binding protein [Alistipes sp.]